MNDNGTDPVNIVDAGWVCAVAQRIRASSGVVHYSKSGCSTSDLGQTRKSERLISIYALG
jgi:hypothetical protein